MSSVQPSSKTRALEDCRSKTHFIHEDVPSYLTAASWGRGPYPVCTSASSEMEKVLHPESQPRVGHHPWRALMVAGTSASRPSTKPYMALDQNDRVRSNANRLLGALSHHEATRSTGQPFAQCASARFQIVLLHSSLWRNGTRTLELLRRCYSGELRDADRVRTNERCYKAGTHLRQPRAIPMAYTKRSSWPF